MKKASQLADHNEILDVLGEAIAELNAAISYIEKGDEPAAANRIMVAVGRLEYALDLLPEAAKADPDLGF